jgi:hypothetical protein
MNYLKQALNKIPTTDLLNRQPAYNGKLTLPSGGRPPLPAVLRNRSMSLPFRIIQRSASVGCSIGGSHWRTASRQTSLTGACAILQQQLASTQARPMSEHRDTDSNPSFNDCLVANPHQYARSTSMATKLTRGYATLCALPVR